jgi:hypothetical protein
MKLVTSGISIWQLCKEQLCTEKVCVVIHSFTERNILTPEIHCQLEKVHGI